MEESAAGKLSKRQQKKLAKQEHWEKKKVLIKQLKKEKKKQNAGSGTRTCHAHLTRFNNVLKEAAGAADNEEFKEGKVHLSKQEKQVMFKALCEKGPKIVIDCEFDELMQERELKSLSQQLAYCHATNKKMR